MENNSAKNFYLSEVLKSLQKKILRMYSVIREQVITDKNILLRSRVHAFIMAPEGKNNFKKLTENIS